ncbi:hypothetical protein M413DRAFT_439414 [Hebeloma cylindrosporum]|uniref:TEL2-interacting protein 1 n=1 Tax=Hebeloma cylindrosporum TaxID=76867 RepID=A0A0C2YD65_HEBCY|nr:hypothetical protein M413DRAFT_439414 [Hebeloma cylindrosporum h7]
MTSSVQTDFNRLKTVCVPLLGASRLTPSSAKTTINLLTELGKILGDIPPENLTSNLISYVFLPVSTILQRNSSQDIPDQILEKILDVMRFLVESWWWSCEIKVWEQVFMLCGSVIGGIDGKSNGKGRSRDDETKEAATRCLLALLRPRTIDEATRRSLPPYESDNRLSEFQDHVQNSKFVPVLGQTLDAVLNSASSQHIPLQTVSLDATFLLVDLYLPDLLIPSVLPGVVSTATKICLGFPHSKGWANGDIVARGLKLLQSVVQKAIGDDVCLKDGALRRVIDLDDLVSTLETPQTSVPDNVPTYGTKRTASWLRGTASQLHIAINSLTPLISHPNSSALNALSNFSAVIIRRTPLSLPQTQPLLLSFLLSLSSSDLPSVSSEATQHLTNLLTVPSDARIPLQHTLMTNLGENLSALPRLISTQSDARVKHAASMIDAVCRLAAGKDPQGNLLGVATGIGKLLGPSGGVEKWGWSLLSVLEIVEPPITVTQVSEAQLALESSEDTAQSLQMFHSLGAAAGDSCLFTVEWFTRLGRSGVDSFSVAALWCACRLLEGLARFSLSEFNPASLAHVQCSRRAEKHARTLAKTIAETWEKTDEIHTPTSESHKQAENDKEFFVQHQMGVIPLHETLKITRATPPETRKKQQPIIHRALCLQLIATSAGITQGRFDPLFIHTLYPVLHSLVSPVSFLSSTALATLNFITIATSYASSANLLLSNFDYVLDSVSRRLTQRWLDIDATKVLGVMVRLVGAQIVEKAADVVEECFDRLDEFHGYGVIVDALIEVLTEVIKVIEIETASTSPPISISNPPINAPHKARLEDFFKYLPQRFEEQIEVDDKDYGPAPRRAWGETEAETEDAEDADDEMLKATPATDDGPLPTPIQLLTKQIISRSIYFLTHDSPAIRARILKLLTSSVPVLPESVLLPSIHSAWPFILNRLGDSETFVVSAAAGLVEALSRHAGDFMFRRLWDDVWPKFRSMLRDLERGEEANALTRSSTAGARPESAYTHSHRLYRSLLRTMTLALKHVHEHEISFWEVIVSFRRFLSDRVHAELQQCAVDLYTQAGMSNPDAVWLLLVASIDNVDPVTDFLRSSWGIEKNASVILKSME